MHSVHYGVAVFGFSSSITFPPYFSGLCRNGELCSCCRHPINRCQGICWSVTQYGAKDALSRCGGQNLASADDDDDVKELCFNTRHTFTHPAAAAVVKTLARTQSSQDTLEQKKC